MKRRVATGTCLVILALGLGGCEQDFCTASVDDPVAALFVGLLCSGVNQRQNVPPTASFTIAPNPAMHGDEVKLDASGSHDKRGGTIVRYEWSLDNFGDNLPGGFEVDSGSDPTIEHRFYRIGLATENQTIGLRVTDASGLTGTVSRRLTILGSGPMARFTVTPNPVEVGEPALFDASSSTGAFTYSWDLDGNGTFEVGPSYEPTLNRTYNAPAAINAGLRVQDMAGQTSEAVVRVIVVSARAATAARRGGARATARRGGPRATARRGARVAAARRAFSARLTGVRIPDDLGRVRRRGSVTTVRGVRVRGRLVARKRGLGALRPFRRARWVARMTLVAKPTGARLRGLALARFPRGGGQACLRIRLQTRRRGAPSGAVRVLGGRGPAARLRGGGRFRFTDLRPSGRLQARLGAPRPLPAACTKLRR